MLKPTRSSPPRPHVGCRCLVRASHSCGPPHVAQCGMCSLTRMPSTGPTEPPALPAGGAQQRAPGSDRLKEEGAGALCELMWALASPCLSFLICERGQGCGVRESGQPERAALVSQRPGLREASRCERCMSLAARKGSPAHGPGKAFQQKEQQVQDIEAWRSAPLGGLEPEVGGGQCRGHS